MGNEEAWKFNFGESKKSRVWTITRTIDYDGSMIKAIAIRAKKEINRFKEYLAPQKGEYEGKEEE